MKPADKPRGGARGKRASLTATSQGEGSEGGKHINGHGAHENSEGSDVDGARVGAAPSTRRRSAPGGGNTRTRSRRGRAARKRGDDDEEEDEEDEDKDMENEMEADWVPNEGTGNMFMWDKLHSQWVNFLFFDGFIF